jgi:hypothetical protein
MTATAIDVPRGPTPWWGLLMALCAVLLAACSNSSDAPPPVAPVAPVIQAQPSDQSTTVGGNASFNVTASAVGAVVAIQWQVLNGNVWTDIAGATAATLTISGATPTQNGAQYRAVVSANGQSLTTTPVTLTVTPAPVPPSISVQPVDVAVTEPAGATFNVTAAGSGTLAYRWQRLAAGTWSDIAGATGASYTTPATQRAADNGAQFRVVVTNSIGSVTSDIATLTVNPAPVAPSFTTNPTDVAVTEPATAIFTVAATGTPAPTLQWQFSTDGGTTWANVATGSGATSATYTTAATAIGMNGWRYRAFATSSAGNAASNAARLTVNAMPSPPTFTQHPSNATVASQTSATFTVVTNAVPTPTYQWQRQAPGGGGFLNITGATAASYTTPAVFFLDDGDVTDNGAQYRVVVTNSQGTSTSNVATLTVTPAVLTGFTQVAAGLRHAVALRSDGTVWAWGDNSYGQVGRTCTACSPRPVNGLTGTFTQVLARNDTSYALRSDGTVWAWGYNGNGQLGRNLTAGNGSGTPAQVVQVSNGQPLTGIVGLTASDASFTGTWVLAWTATGVAWKWGLNFSEPGLGGYPGNNILAAVPHIYFDGSTAARSLNRAVAGGLALLAYIDGTGTAGFWTCNFGGCSGGTTAATPFSTLGFTGTAIDLAADLGDRVVLVRSDNTLWGQAYRDTGFGIGWDDLRSALVQLAVPEGVTRVAVGRSGTVTYAVGLSGTVYAAGDDLDGQLGDGSAGGRRTNFAPVLGVNDAAQPSIGRETGHVLRAGGAISAWGNNTYRANGTTDSANRPVGSPGWLQIEATAFATRGR